MRRPFSDLACSVVGGLLLVLFASGCAPAWVKPLTAGTEALAEGDAETALSECRKAWAELASSGGAHSSDRRATRGRIYAALCVATAHAADEHWSEVEATAARARRELREVRASMDGPLVSEVGDAFLTAVFEAYLGVAALREGRFGDAESRFTSMLEVSSLEPTRLFIPMALLARAEARDALEREDEAIEDVDAALAELDALAPNRPYLTGTFRGAAGWFDFRARRLGRAERWFTEAVARLETLDGEEGRRALARALRGLSEVRDAQGREEEAGALGARASALASDVKIPASTSSTLLGALREGPPVMR